MILLELNNRILEEILTAKFSRYASRLKYLDLFHSNAFMSIVNIQASKEICNLRSVLYIVVYIFSFFTAKNLRQST